MMASDGSNDHRRASTAMDGDKMAWLVDVRLSCVRSLGLRKINEPTLACVNAAFGFNGINDHFDMCEGL